MTYLMLLVGLALLAGGGELLVRGAVGLARRFGVSPLMVGLTVVAFGTSMPEMVVSVDAALRGSPGIAIGNIVGSNIFNVFAILGLAALIFPVVCSRRAITRDVTVVVLASLLLTGLMFTGHLSRLMGYVFIALLLANIVFTFRQERGHAHADDDTKPLALPMALGCIAVGLGLLAFGANLLVTNAIEIAKAMSVSDTVIGLTIVAAGTSLPEVAASVVAAFRKQADIAFGNIVGSNAFNILGILGVTAVVSPIPVPMEMLKLDVWVMIAAAAAMFLPLLTGYKIGRTMGVFFLGAYVVYVLWLLGINGVGPLAA